MVAEHLSGSNSKSLSCSLAKISMVAELSIIALIVDLGCSLAKISMVAERTF